ncbi:hypothetical protein HMPREF2976_01510 [Corynebacterium sp. HMSC077D10]|nr:hypothetical protein HMPREF2976_01510 [Corynebacterium sp. HMSC077D10]
MQSKSVLTMEKWIELETKLFDNNDHLKRMHTYARQNFVQPVPFLVSSLIKILACVPPGTPISAGAGNTVPNMFLALYAKPGSGKDRAMNLVEEGIRATWNGQPWEPLYYAPGSGEGIMTAFLSEGSPIDRGVIFQDSEIGFLETLMGRQGATTRQMLMKVFSGNRLGTTNRGAVDEVPPNSYVGCLMVGVQPDKAQVLVDSQVDDGLAHRFLWTEVLDPTRPDEFDDGAQPVELDDIVIPKDIQTKGFTFPQRAINETRAIMNEQLKYGGSEDGRGHRNLMRIRIAAGFALLDSRTNVKVNDWERAGALLDYSDTVRAGVVQHFNNMATQRAMEYAQWEEDRADARDVTRRKRLYRNFINYLWGSDDSWEGDELQTLSEYRTNSVRHDQRKMFDSMIDELAEQDVIRLSIVNGKKYPQRGINFPDSPPA